MIVSTSSNKEDMVKIAIEEFSYHSEVFEPCVQNEKVEVHVYKKVSNDDGSDLFFNLEYIYFQGYYKNCGNGEYVDILCLEDMNNYDAKACIEEMEFWILKAEKILSEIWIKKKKRNRDHVTDAKMNDKMSKNWKTRKKE